MRVRPITMSLVLVGNVLSVVLLLEPDNSEKSICYSLKIEKSKLNYKLLNKRLLGISCKACLHFFFFYLYFFRGGRKKLTKAV